MIEKWDQRFLELAKFIAAWSKDPSTKVGAVLVDSKRRVIGIGYNGFSRGVNDDDGRYADRAVKYEIVVHAEVNALLNSAKSLEDATLYVWPLFPCSRCAAQIIQSGVKRVVSLEKSDGNISWASSNSLAQQIFEEAGVKYERIFNE